MEATQLQIFTIISAIAAIAALAVLVVLRGTLQKLNVLNEKREQALREAQAVKQAPAPAPVFSQQTVAPAAVPAATAPQAAPAAQGISGEILAVIAAAAYTLYDIPASAIQSVTLAEPAPLALATAAPAPRTRSTWATAGLLENTRPF